MNITIIGIGGVGGYIGGMLAEQYANHENIHIHFICRGEHLAAIQKSGLELDTKEGKRTVKPYAASNRIASNTSIDYLILATKSYDLSSVMEEITPNISEQTIILPLFNGVDSFEIITQRFPGNEVWNGCVYMVARKIDAGKVAETGHAPQLYFGLENGNTSRLKEFEEICKSASIPTFYVTDITKTVWEKYVFISVMASLTSYYDSNFGEVLGSDERKVLLNQLLDEVIALSKKMGVNLDSNIKEITLAKISKLPAHITSSMHSDFIKENKTELNSLCKYVLEKAKLFNLSVPGFTEMYDRLSYSFGSYYLRQLKRSDAAAYYHLINDNLDRFTTFFPMTVEGCKTLESTRFMLNERLEKSAKKEFISFLIFERKTEKLIGSVFLKDIDWRIPKSEIGYFIDKDYERKGIISKAMAFVERYCFDELKLVKIFMRIVEENVASKKVAEKCNFDYEGTIRQDFKSGDGRLWDALYFGKLNEVNRE